MKFKELKLKDWQQFASIEVSLDERVTILTGANGSGKTTILSLLARHRNWYVPSLATPRSDLKTKAMKYFPLARLLWGADKNDRSIGSIEYASGALARLHVPDTENPQYQVQIDNQQMVPVFFIPSHRQTFAYRRISSISTVRKERQSAFDEFQNVYISRLHGSHSAESTSSVIKGTLLGWMINGYGVRSGAKVIMPQDPTQIKNFEGFRDVLRKVLPENLGFEDLEVRDYELVFSCNGGADDFLLETSSGGVAALIDMAWQIFMFDGSGHETYTVVIDEVENHLHPSMQRTLLPKMIEAFPRARFIVSTHSPLVVTSVEGARVYVLRYEQKKVVSTVLDLKSEVRNALDILDEVLGVSTTLPAWAVEKLAGIIDAHSSMATSSDSLRKLRSDLANAGLERLFPQAITAIAENEH
ncbi:DNA replication and repair protein RecF [Xanthomonas arboricola pv. juglandis]|uniref:AAA family ATPase n=1 Tax=Xanthomonas TaxID=338 RepID=UPI000E5C0D5A|nr:MULTISPECIES: AAA family ATPase [Xanthomonas]CAD1787381.1 AAA family ATPase [Xanthomonas sp. CPBF 426]CAG2084237.1 AAA family ATPase [Xanthomonas euroxanthea]SYZ55819.1 DNA replication and repair protein RecF [Xanthomonas arboricola pv. juglandis]